MITFIYGPPGSGKSTNAEQLREKYGCKRVVDEYIKEMEEELRWGDLVLSQYPEDAPEGARVFSISEALK